MAKKKLGNPFASDNTHGGDTSFEAADAVLYGEIAKVDEGRQVAKPISIFDIVPDSAQPRRAIPSAVRAQWDGNPHMLGKLLGVWLDMAQAEKGAPLDVAAWLDGDEFSEDYDMPPPSGPIEASLMQIVELAASINRVGLTNPITIVQHDQGYQLETGERRWMAYHLLYANYRDEKWTKVPARVVDQFNIWRQAMENSARSDLNAIGKARQYAILMMDLWMREPDATVNFRPITDFPSERAFYAQVFDLRVPRGKSPLLLSATGTKNRSTLSNRRALLDLPDEAWRIADDYNLAEDTLLSFKHLPADQMIVALHKTAGKVQSLNFSPSTKSQSKPAGILIAKQHKLHFNKVWKLAARVEAGVTDFSDKELESLTKMRRWLDEVENTIQSRRQERKK